METIASEFTTIGVALIVAGAAMLAGTRATKRVGRGNHDLAKRRMKHLDTAAGGVMGCGTAALGLTLTSALAAEVGLGPGPIVDAARPLTEIAIAIGACATIVYPTIWAWWLTAHAIEHRAERT